MDSVQTQTIAINGVNECVAYIDFCDGQLCVSVVVEGKQADFSFEPVTLGILASAYKLHCEECKKERRLIMDNRGLSDKIIDTVRAIRKIPREQIKDPFEIQIIVVKPKD